MQRVVLWMVLSVVWLLWGLESVAAGETYRYLAQEGGPESVVIDWQVERGEEVKLTVAKAGETHVSRNDAALATFEWEFREPSRNTCVVARRQGDYIEVKGTHRGRGVEGRLQIDAAPWYQAISLSLRPFIGGEVSEMEFWTLRPDTLSVHRVKARKLGTELLRWEGREVEVERVRISLTGFTQGLWHCFYWYRRSDGVFMRYEGSTGVLGARKCTIGLAGTGR